MIETARREMIYFRYYFSIQFEQVFQYWKLGMVLGSVVHVFLKDYIHNAFRSMGEKKLGIVKSCSGQCRMPILQSGVSGKLGTALM